MKYHCPDCRKLVTPTRICPDCGRKVYIPATPPLYAIVFVVGMLVGTLLPRPAEIQIESKKNTAADRIARALERGTLRGPNHAGSKIW